MAINTESIGGAVRYFNIRPPIKESKSRLNNWHPIWLGKPLLYIFISLFILLAASLILIIQLIDHLNGFSLALTKNHYVWTYGPTSVLVVVVAFWRRVQYCVIINQPWQEMSNGPQPAAKTLLLDYLSPLEIQSLVRAFRNRHFAVAASISVFALLKLVIVLSTTMFLPKDNISTRQINVTQETRFGAEKATFLHGDNDFEMGLGWTYRSSVSSEPVWSYFDLRNKYGNSNIPTELSTAFTNYSVTLDIPTDSFSVSSEVEEFQPMIICEPATIDYLPASDQYYYKVKLDSRCKTEVLWLDPRPNRIDNTDENLTFALFRLGCSVDDNLEPSSNLTPEGHTTTDPYQYVMMTMRWTGKGKYKEELDTVKETAATSCRLTYSVQPANAIVSALDPGHIQSLEAKANSRSKIANLSDLQLSEAVFSSLDRDPIITKYYESNYTTAGGTLLGFMVNTTWAGSLESLSNITVLQRAAEEVLTGICHQLIRHYFLLPEKNVASGSVEFKDTRLHCRPVVIWAMASLLIITSCLVFVVLIFSRCGVAPQSPSTLASMASTLSRSPAMARLLPPTRDTFMSQAHEELRSYRFFTTQSHTGLTKIETIEDPNRIKANPEEPNPGLQAIEPWSPYPSRRHMVILTIALPVFSIITLEVLWHKVQHGTIDTPSSEWSTAAYAIRYGSAAVALLTATLFNSLDFSIASMTVFSHLASKPTNAKRSLYLDVLQDLPPVAFYKAIRYRHFSPAFSLLAVALGSTLTIISSGLWFMDTSIPTTISVTAKAQSGWLINNHTIPEVAAWEKLFQDIHHKVYNDAELPELIWDTNLVLPAVRTVDIPQSLLQINTGKPHHFDFILKAIQPFIECYDSPQDTLTLKHHIVPPKPDQIKVYLPNGSAEFFQPNGSVIPQTTTVDITSGLDNDIGSPVGCQFPPGHNTRKLSYGWNGVSLDKKTNVFEHADMLVMSIDLVPIPSIDRPAEDSDSSSSCPSFAVILYNATAHWDPDKEDQMTSRLEATALVCTQRLRLVETVVTYLNDDQRLSPQQGPGKVENVQYSVSNGPPNSTTSLMPPQETGLLSHPFNVVNILGKIVMMSDFDFGFYHGGTQALAAANKTIDATERAYRFMMTTILDSEFRPKGNKNTTDEEEIQGELKTFTSRLRMSKTSKITLQAVLGAMAVLGALAHQLMDTRGILLQNPLSIASKMSLFSESRLLWLLQDSHRDSSDEQSDASDDDPRQHTQQEEGAMMRPEDRNRKSAADIMRGRLFRLGWWEETENKNNKPDASSNDGGNNTGNETSSSDDNQSILAREGDEETSNLGGKRFGIDLYEPSSDEDI